MSGEIPEGMRPIITVKDIVNNLSPQLKREIGVVDFNLIHEVAKDVPDAGIVQSSASLLIKTAYSQTDQDSFGVTAAIIDRFFGSILPPEQAQQIKDLSSHAQAESNIARSLNTQLALLDGKVTDYFSHTDKDFDYWVSTPLLKEIASIVLNLSVVLKARHLQQEFSVQETGKENIAEVFKDQNSDMLGLWISNKGVHFDASKLERN